MEKIIRFVTTMLVISFSGLLGSSAVFADEIVKYSFLVKVPEIGVIPFTSCTGMGSESEVIELMVNIPGYNSNHIKNPRKVCSTNIVCKRPILPKTGIWEWQEHIVGKSGGIDYKENFSKDIFVVALDPQSQEMAWWYLYRAWPSKVVCLYDGERLIEEVVLVSDFTLRLNSPPTNWESYEPPTPGLSTVEPPKVEMSTGYVVAPGAKAQGDQQVDLSGTWNSNIGLVYQISQNGNKLSYQDPMMHKPVNGTVDGKTVTVSWTEGNAVKNLKGTITSTGNDGKAKRIEWENSVVFNR